MIRNTPDDTIAHLATPPGAGALAVARVSGSRALEIADRVFSGRRRLADLGGFEGSHGWIRDRGRAVDEVVAWVYRAPRSYTGEDMVEFSCHGGSIPARRVLETLWRAGARPAEPGEFTRRAFLGGRIDLAQAEAVADLIAARGRRAHEQAIVQLEGGLSRRVRETAGRVREVLARVEGHLDFGDDVPECPDAGELITVLEAVEHDLEHLVASHASSRRARDGMVVALAGRPNVGKSSLLNALSGEDRAIVHDAPGTTRDTVDVLLEWSGIPVRLVDTAGIRPTGGPVEEAGIDRSRRELRRADLVLWVVDASGPWTAADEAVAGLLDFTRVHLVLNKVDLEPDADPSGWVNGYSPREIHRTSALTGAGIADLGARLEAELMGGLAGVLEPEDLWITNTRHARALEGAREALVRALGVLREGRTLELAAADLHRSLDALAAVTGERADADLLDTIFKRFCIGK